MHFGFHRSWQISNFKIYNFKKFCRIFVYIRVSRKTETEWRSVSEIKSENIKFYNPNDNSDYQNSVKYIHIELKNVLEYTQTVFIKLLPA